MSSTLATNILDILANENGVDSLGLAARLKEDHQKVVGAIKSLQSVEMIDAEQKSQKKWELSEEGRQVAVKGSHEALVYHAIPKEGILQSELMKTFSNAKVGFSKAMSAGWIKVDKSSGSPLVVKKMDSIQDAVQDDLHHILNNNAAQVSDSQCQEYKKRKLLQEVVVKSYHITRGKAFGTPIVKQETDLTPEMIASGSWKEKCFKPYNLDALGVPPASGHLHPLLNVRAEFRDIFLELGFTEMPTNNYVESSFWNFDALFQPQQHPARDAQDTFFVSDPQLASDFPLNYLNRVKDVHSKGGFGSRGYGYDWKLEEARKNILRTHTTAVSARMLYKLAMEGFRPVKYFSIDKVFRNETLDATHLAEFNQIEGVVAGYGITLGNLIGILHEFFRKLGIEKLRFKPAYNPYTEPSMEIFSYHDGLNKWVEVGNSGMFRPEMLLPMGLPEGVNVIAWGLSLERPTMIKYGLNNIRDLVGHKVNLQMVHESPICRLDKDDVNGESTLRALQCRWERAEKKLEKMRLDVENVKKLIGRETFPKLRIFANPKHPPYSVSILLHLLQQSFEFTISTHNETEDRKGSAVVVIWDTTINLPFMIAQEHAESCKLVDEADMARYLTRLLETKSSEQPLYEAAGPSVATSIDSWLETVECENFLKKPNYTRTIKKLDGILGHQKWIAGNLPTLADIVIWSQLQAHGLVDNVPHNVKHWLDICEYHILFAAARNTVPILRMSE